MSKSIQSSLPAQFSPWPYGIIGFFVLLFVGGVALYITATSGPSQWLEGNPYEDGLRYQEVIEQEQRFRSLGLQVQIDLSSEGVIAVTLLDAQGQPIAGRHVLCYAMRPGNSALDLRFSMDEDPKAQGVYRDSLGRSLARGLWVIDLQVTTEQGIARSRSRIVR